MTNLILERIKERRKSEADQKRINACVVPIDEDLSKKAKKLLPACEGIRQREGAWEWAIDGTEGREWFPIWRLPADVEWELRKEINRKDNLK